MIVAVNLALGMLGVLMVAPTVFLPTYAQTVLGLGPIAAGFVLSVMTLSWPLSAALSNRVYLRIGFRNTSALGMAAATVVLVVLVMLPYAGPAWQPTLVMLLLGGALGLFQLPLIVGVQSTVPWSERATATSSILFCRQVGQSVGAAVFGAVANATLASRLHGSGTDLDSIMRPRTRRRAGAPRRRGGRQPRLRGRGGRRGPLSGRRPLRGPPPLPGPGGGPGSTVSPWTQGPMRACGPSPRS